MPPSLLHFCTFCSVKGRNGRSEYLLFFNGGICSTEPWGEGAHY